MRVSRRSTFRAKLSKYSGSASRPGSISSISSVFAISSLYSSYMSISGLFMGTYSINGRRGLKFRRRIKKVFGNGRVEKEETGGDPPARERLDEEPFSGRESRTDRKRFSGCDARVP